jgi:hypothetical protein
MVIGFCPAILVIQITFLISVVPGFSQSNTPQPFILGEIREIQSTILNEKEYSTFIYRKDLIATTPRDIV